MVPSPPRLVVFDLGGVLVRICRSFGEACAAAGLPRRDGADTPAAAAARLPWVVEHEVGRLTPDAYFAGLSSSMAGLYSPEEVRRIHAAWMFGEYPGVVAILDALDAARVETAILSNTNGTHWARLDPGPRRPPEFPVTARIPRRFASHLLGLRKPSRACFAHVEAATGRRGSEILFFDDLPDNVEGARALAWRAETIDPDADPAAQMLGHLRRHGIAS